MDTSVLASTFLLTPLLLVGLFFFIRASVKDRTQVVKLRAEQAEDLALMQLQQYFNQRAYQVAEFDAAQHWVKFEGFVRPSLPLAIFLTGLAAVGTLCLALVLAILFPKISIGLLALVFLSPLAGVFYWRNAGRPETVQVQVESVANDDHLSCGSLITVTAHRDELAAMQRSLSLKGLE